MSELLAKVFKKVSEELPECEQDAFAEWLLQIIENDERLWDAQFAALQTSWKSLPRRRWRNTPRGAPNYSTSLNSRSLEI